MTVGTEEVETAARTAWNCGAYSDTTRIVLEAFGRELYSFVLAQFRGRTGDADEVFSQFCEDLWVGLPGFQWRCSIRAWCYRIVRSAASRHRRSPFNRGTRRVPLSAAPWLDELIARTRTATQQHLRSEVKDEVQALREQLTREDQDLLILRVDRGLSWRDIAHAMVPPEEADEERIRRLEVALRQRFADVKRRLRRLAGEAGLV
jgi:RNA polymerase sigma-70 factor (ECF subfamily)